MPDSSKIEKLQERIKELEEKIDEDNSRTDKQKENTTRKNSRKISRRDFLKKTGLGALGIGALSLSPTSAFDIKDSNGLSVYTDGMQNFEVQPNGNVNIPNGQLSEQGNRVATRNWVNNNIDDLSNNLTIRDMIFSGFRIDADSGWSVKPHTNVLMNGWSDSFFSNGNGTRNCFTETFTDIVTFDGTEDRFEVDYSINRTDYTVGVEELSATFELRNENNSASSSSGNFSNLPSNGTYDLIVTYCAEANSDNQLTADINISEVRKETDVLETGVDGAVSRIDGTSKPGEATYIPSPSSLSRYVSVNPDLSGDVYLKTTNDGIVQQQNITGFAKIPETNQNLEIIAVFPPNSSGYLTNVEIDGLK